MHVIDKQHVVSFVIIANHFVSHFAANVCSLCQSDYDRSSFLLLRISDKITCFYMSPITLEYELVSGAVSLPSMEEHRQPAHYVGTGVPCQ